MKLHIYPTRTYLVESGHAVIFRLFSSSFTISAVLFSDLARYPPDLLSIHPPFLRKFPFLGSLVCLFLAFEFLKF